MQNSRAVEQACAVLALLGLADDQKTVTNDELTTRLGGSPTYLKKITRKLVVYGLITSSQGVKGGFALARDMSKISLFDVVEAMNGNRQFFATTGLIARVFADKQPQAEYGMGLVEEAFARAQGRWSTELRNTTLHDIARQIEVMHE